jgi:hypothetical protein
MANTTELADAYAATEAAEKQAILDVEAAKKAYNEAIDAIIARFPTPGAMTPARVYLTSAKNAGLDYQLTTLKQQYGMVAPVTMLTPTSTGGGTNG